MQITRFSIHQTSKIVALVYFCFTLLFMPFFIFIGFQDAGPMKWFFAAAPLFYGVIGYVFTAFSCVVYNLLAKRFGGIEFSVSDSAHSLPAAPATLPPNLNSDG